MSAIGVSAIAASAEATTVESRRPSATRVHRDGDHHARARARNASGPPWKPSAKKTMPSSIVHWKTQKSARRMYFENT